MEITIDIEKEIEGFDEFIDLEKIEEYIKKALEKEYPEDEEKMYLEEIQELITKYNKLIDEEIKEKEIVSNENEKFNKKILSCK